MRITDSRYDRDRLRLALAHRLIGLEARTRTIREATQLSDDRIRRIYRDYFGGSAESTVRRHRGKSPRQMSFFRRTLEHELEAATLGSLLLQCGLLRRSTQAFRPDVVDVSRFCDVYETFKSVIPEPHVTFEHAWHLWQVFCRDDEYVLSNCPGCSALWVRDTLEILPDSCPTCRRGPRAPDDPEFDSES
jgi:hypothetical protein